MSSLLIHESPLQVLPSLAVALGDLNGAIVLQQVHYWLSRDSAVNRNGRRWVYNSVAEWRKQFPFWSEDTIARTLKALREKGVLVAESMDARGFNRTLYYSIDYALVDQLAHALELSELSSQPTANEPVFLGEKQPAESITASCGNREPQVAVIDGSKVRASTAATCQTPLPQSASLSNSTETTYIDTPPTPSEGDTGSSLKRFRSTRNPARAGEDELIALAEMLEACRAAGEQAIPADDPVYAYCDDACIGRDILLLHWTEFKTRHLAGTKRKRGAEGWRAALRESVRLNAFRLWFIGAEGEAELTTAGRQAQLALDASEARRRQQPQGACA